jgi:mRNA interferase RelE/StbE
LTPWVSSTLVWQPSAAAALDALAKHDPRLAERLHTALGDYALTGHGDVRPLHGQPGLRLRLGDWRVIFELDTVRREVTILALAHRRDSYRG